MSKVVVIDPGHGGQDPGAVDSVQPWQGDMLATREDEVAYDIAARARRALEAAGYAGYLTRALGEFSGLQNRCALANRVGAVAFVSVHVNAAENPAAAGIETFSYPGAVMGAKLRNLVHREVTRLAPQFRDRGPKAAKHYVTRYTRMPACLVECGFCTNPEDEQLMQDPGMRIRLAQGIANGIALFLGGG